MSKVFGKALEATILGLFTLPIFILQIIVINIFCRLLYAWGWLDLTWLEAALLKRLLVELTK